MPKIEKAFLILLIIIALLLLILALKNSNTEPDEVFKNQLKLENTINKSNIYKNVKIINFDKSFTLEKIDLNNENELIQSLLFKTELLNISSSQILNILPRIENLSKIKNLTTKEVTTLFPWEIPLSNLSNIKFSEPIKNFYFRNSESIYPGATRYYRHGIHRGIDFSDLKNGMIAKTGEPIYAIYPGKIVKIKNTHKEFANEEKFYKLKLLSKKYYYTHEDYLDFFRGNQIYIRNGNMFFIYAHLDRVNKKLKLYQYVKSGELLGYMGNTGVEYMGVRAHLHLEIYFGNFIIGINRFRRPFEKSLKIYKKLFNYKD